MRFIGKNTVLDVILAFMLGATMSRAINTEAPFFPSLLAGLVLVLLHGAFAMAASRSERFDTWIDGRPHPLVKDGAVDSASMRAHAISRHDLHEAIRAQGQVEETREVKVATLERNGVISVIPKEKVPKVVEVDVAAGVQTVRIEIG
ncbi:MAG: DUF421 domain-containing protein [Methanobacteriota archaeon]